MTIDEAIKILRQHNITGASALKAAVEDFNEMKPYLSEPYSHLCDKWRFADEALALIGEDGDLE